MKKTIYPDFFHPERRPISTAGNIPQKIIKESTRIAKVQIYDYETLTIEEGFEYVLEIECNYDCADNIFLIKQTTEDMENVNYKSELASYKRRQKKDGEALKQWEEWKVIWDKEELKKVEIKERSQLNKLKEKYER